MAPTIQASTIEDRGGVGPFEDLDQGLAILKPLGGRVQP